MKKNWFALYTYPRHEFKVEHELKDLNIEAYLPIKTEQRQWSDRKKKIDGPLIPGYIFIKATERERLDAHAIKSILKTVSFESKPAIIPDWQIENLKLLLAQTNEILVTDRFKPGSKVKIISGPMKDIEGQIVTRENNHYLGIAIDALKMGVLVKISEDQILFW